MLTAAQIVMLAVRVECPSAIDAIHGFLADHSLTWEQCWQTKRGGRNGPYLRNERASKGRAIVFAVLWSFGMSTTEIGYICGMDHSTVYHGIRRWSGVKRVRRTKPPATSPTKIREAA